MTKLSELPGEMVGEILTRVPLTSLRVVRSTCKNWSDLSKNQIIGEATTRKQFLGFLLINYTLCSLRFDLQGIRCESDSCVDLSIKKVSVTDDDEAEIYNVFHCDGLLLCVTSYEPKLMVWNPYLGETRWIHTRDYESRDEYVLGYDNNHNHKILRALLDEEDDQGCNRKLFEIYEFSSNSWRALDVTPVGHIYFDEGVSLKGNAYFVDREPGKNEPFLLCFDFTTERFEPRLALPVAPYPNYLSCVREEKLALLSQEFVVMEIWITTKIEANAVSWSNFFKLDMIPLNGILHNFDCMSFFIDEKKRVVMIFGAEVSTEGNCYETAYIIGQDGYVKSVNIGEAWKPEKQPWHIDLCTSYVPSLVQLKINQPPKRKERDF